MSQTTRGTSSSIGTYLMLGLIVLGFVALGAIFYLGSVNLCSTNCAVTTTIVTSGSSTFTSTISSTTTSRTITTSSAVSSSTTITSTTTTTTTSSIATSNTAQRCNTGETITIHVFNPVDGKSVVNDHVSVTGQQGNPNYAASGITDINGNFVYCGYPNVDYIATENLTGASISYATSITNNSLQTFQLPLNIIYISPHGNSVFTIAGFPVTYLDIVAAIAVVVIISVLALGLSRSGGRRR